MQSLDELSRVDLKSGQTPLSDDIDVWYWRYERDMDDAFSVACDDLLTAEERERQRSYLFDADRRLFLATRTLVRTALAHYAPVAPRDWRFEKTAHGKPYVCGPAGVSRIHFNLANAKGLVVCAISGAHSELGIDVEGRSRLVDTETLVESALSSAERAALRALPENQRHERFLQYWTLKESYVKARGLGLSLPFEAISFQLSPDLRLELAPDFEDQAWRWRFAQLCTDSHLLAVCAPSGCKPLSLRGVEFVPKSVPVWQQCVNQR